MVDKVVLDTSFIIELLDRGRKELSEYVVKYSVLIPYVVLYEYLYGYSVLKKDVERPKKILEGLGEIVWMNQGILMKLLEVSSLLERRGLVLPEGDLIIASISLYYDAPIVTYDVKHFEGLEEIGVTVIKP